LNPIKTIVAIEALPDRAVLAREWRDLEGRSDASFFTSWSWLGVWLASLQEIAQPRLLRARQDERTVGLALVVERRALRYRVLPVREWHVNATGDQRLDALMIEYNDVLVDRDSVEPASVRAQMASAIVADTRLDELHFAGVRRSDWEKVALPGFHRAELERSCRGVDLAEVRERGEYLPLISANSRSKIRKALKDGAQIGALRFEVAADLPQADEMYDTMCRLHGQAWTARGEPGAFANPFLLEFHRRLIRERLASGEIQLARVWAGEQVLGVLYGFIHRGRVFCYQSGFDFSLGPKQFKPGLVAHAMAIEFNARLGHAYYDFMAGDSQYKRSMGTRSDSLHWVVYQRDSLKFRLTNRLRELKRRLRPVRLATTPAPEDQA
jgi:CelD/BcsL family acetyltransferase involved in cellulose biosynthesis